MARFSPTHILIIALLLTVLAMVPLIDAQKRCEEILNPTSCDLATCREQCFKKHNSNGGQCVVNGGTPAEPTYECLCVYDCPPAATA
ncbi:S locus-related glycoprotein 1 binding pollen coat [Corchorus olitorius]|uniref:S locus-related glycoprotein 1 binding pollen coat n=1 Tax=Corchorus olitorius TaxID=93759 RepID=A0A1R3JKD5_9ROSI|nr:S locus-related glycoprotein 1 binding pollen coat [Corchorus olitorius]